MVQHIVLINIANPMRKYSYSNEKFFSKGEEDEIPCEYNEKSKNPGSSPFILAYLYIRFFCLN